MRSKSILSLAAAVLALGLAAPKPVAAGGYYRHAYGVDHSADPYAYRFEPRGYYPYYNSDYWRPAAELRLRRKHRYVLPPYYQAWGHPNDDYGHVEWHLRHHGGHRIGHW